jgi:transaldolase
MNQLDQLKQFTTVVADTGNFLQMAQYAPRDATTNPSLILKAVQQADYAPLLADTVAAHRGQPIDQIVDQVLVRFGLQILKIVPGRVSTEVDARLSFDSAASMERARRIIDLYERAGIARERVLIKVASTWEGITAASQLEREGIVQPDAVVFVPTGGGVRAGQGDADIALRRPHLRLVQEAGRGAVGRGPASGANDPGVKSVARIYHHYKHFGIRTEVMGASFRSVGQILALAGCDLTISTELLAQLQSSAAPVPRALDAERARQWRCRRPFR